MPRIIGALTAVVAALLSVSQAQAHARLVHATPAADASVATPRQIILTFNERLEPRFSGFELSRAGVRVPVKSGIGKDRRSIAGWPARPLAPGAYRVAWHAVTADSHRVRGVYRFTVR